MRILFFFSHPAQFHFSKLAIEELKMKKLSKECGFSNSKLFLDKLHEITEQIKKYYQNIFN